MRIDRALAANDPTENRRLDAAMLRFPPISSPEDGSSSQDAVAAVDAWFDLALAGSFRARVAPTGAIAGALDGGRAVKDAYMHECLQEAKVPGAKAQQVVQALGVEQGRHSGNHRSIAGDDQEIIEIL